MVSGRGSLQERGVVYCVLGQVYGNHGSSVWRLVFVKVASDSACDCLTVGQSRSVLSEHMLVIG